MTVLFTYQSSFLLVALPPVSGYLFHLTGWESDEGRLPLDARQEAFLLEVYRFTIFTKGFAATEVGFFFFNKTEGQVKRSVSLLVSREDGLYLPCTWEGGVFS